MPHMAAPRRLAQEAVKRVPALRFIVTVGEDQDGGQVGDPPDQVPQRIKRRIVSPVNVLDGQHSRMLGPVKLRTQRGEHPVAIAAVRDSPAELCSHAAHEVAERPEGPRGREVIAIAHEHPALGGQMGAQGVNQARLPDPRLTVDQHGRAIPAGRRLHGVGQRRQLGLALQDPPPHTMSLEASGP